MSKYIFLFFSIILFSIQCFSQISISQFPNKASFRAVEYFSEQEIWISGSKGSILFCEDNGQTWTNKCPTEYATFDFRGIAVLNKNTVLAMSAGDAAEGKAFVIKSSDRGKTWTKVLDLKEKGIFFDCIKFENEKVGYILSDPIDSKPFLLQTQDGGETWHRMDKTKFEDLLPDDASFAASNSNISLFKNHIWFNTQNRIYHSRNSGKSWEIINTPFPKSKSSGIFGILFSNAETGYLVGGDYMSKTDSTLQFAYTNDGGKKWHASDFQIGLSEGLAITQNKKLIRASLQGVFEFKNQKWHLIDKTPFHAVSCYQNSCILVGGNGNIGILK